MNRFGIYMVIIVSLLACQPKVEAPPMAPASAPASAPSDPLAEAAALDQRIAVPMPPQMAVHHREQMRSHLEVVQAIVAALAEDDFDAAQAAAEKIAFSNKMARQCEMMGRGAEGFTEQAFAFHREADKIVEATGRRDTKAALKALGATISTCTACHSAFRQEVVTWSDWKARSRPG